MGKASRLWIQLIMTVNFILATIYVITKIVHTGMLVYSALIGYQNLTLIERLPLLGKKLVKINLLTVWIGPFQVRVSSR